MAELNIAGSQTEPSGRNNLLHSDAAPAQTSVSLTTANLENQVRELHQTLAAERRQNQRLLEINEFAGLLENVNEQPVSAQIIAVALQRAIGCSLVCVMTHSPIEQILIAQAAAGPEASCITPNYRHSLSNNLVGRAIRAYKTLIRQPHQNTQKPLEINSRAFLSEMVIPLIHNGHLEGIILLASLEKEAFCAQDIPYVEILAERLLENWESNRYNHELTELSRQAASLSSISESNNLLTRIAEIAQSMLQATFVLVASFDQHDWQMGTSGKAPHLFQSIRTAPYQFLSEIARSDGAVRLRDVRRESYAGQLTLDSADLRTLLACPMRSNAEPVGVILAFGKKNGSSFTEREAFLTELLSIHAVTALERCLLDQEVRSMLKTTQLLNDLSLRITEAEDLTAAAQVIARIAFRLFQAETCGLLLYSENQHIEASVQFPITTEKQPDHPIEIIREVMRTRQIAYQVVGQHHSLIAIPIQTQRRCYGVLWLSISKDSDSAHRPVDEIRILINQSSVALERSILLAETRQQASEISHGYTQLETSYDQTLLALTKALDARDHETERHTLRVTRIALEIGYEIGLSANELKALKRGSILHDIGKVGVSDSILLKKGALDNSEWEIMRRHPRIGGKIAEVVPALSDALPVIVHHHERWDGTGYPDALKEKNIPLLARIFAVADVFDALTNDRPYRPQKYSPTEALNYLQSQSGIQFDPDIVRIFTRIYRKIVLPEHLDE